MVTLRSNVAWLSWDVLLGFHPLYLQWCGVYFRSHGSSFVKLPDCIFNFNIQNFLNNRKICDYSDNWFFSFWYCLKSYTFLLKWTAKLQQWDNLSGSQRVVGIFRASFKRLYPSLWLGRELETVLDLFVIFLTDFDECVINICFALRILI